VSILKLVTSHLPAPNCEKNINRIYFIKYFNIFYKWLSKLMFVVLTQNCNRCPYIATLWTNGATRLFAHVAFAYNMFSKLNPCIEYLKLFQNNLLNSIQNSFLLSIQWSLLDIIICLFKDITCLCSIMMCYFGEIMNNLPP
jgi:hypothetical protein